MEGINHPVFKSYVAQEVQRSQPGGPLGSPKAAWTTGDDVCAGCGSFCFSSMTSPLGSCRLNGGYIS